jgi:hypothetical protein
MIFLLKSSGMAADFRHDITCLLTAWGKGELEALDELMPIVYPELRRIARKHLAGGGPGTDS